MSRFKIQKDELEIEPDAIVDTEEHDLYECRTWAMSELCDLLNQQDEKIKELKNKLSEKDKEITRLKNELLQPQSEIINSKEDVIDIIQSLKLLQNQKAIEELEKIKSYIKSEIEDAKVLLDPIEYEDYHEMLGVVRGYKLSLEIVDNRIKELKGE